jgi:hypothetical protein
VIRHVLEEKQATAFIDLCRHLLTTECSSDLDFSCRSLHMPYCPSVLVVRFVASAKFRERSAVVRPQDLVRALQVNFY